MVLACLVPPVNLHRLAKEPLVHFLLAGAAIFTLTHFAGGDSDSRSIHIDRDDMLVFMQGQAQVYDEETFAALLRDMSAEDRASLIHDTLLEEALYREGQALNLAAADPMVRQRIVQQMRQIIMEEAAAGLTVSDEETREYYVRNTAQYTADAGITFSHVFLAAPATRADAERMLATLRRHHVPAERAGEFGDRFLYQLNYSEAPYSVVESHFGSTFAEAAFAFDEMGNWQGPVQSQYGWHLVLPIRFQSAQTPTYEEIAAVVAEDALAEKRQLAAASALDTMLEGYRVTIEDGLEP